MKRERGVRAGVMGERLAVESKIMQFVLEAENRVSRLYDAPGKCLVYLAT